MWVRLHKSLFVPETKNEENSRWVRKPCHDSVLYKSSWKTPAGQFKSKPNGQWVPLTVFNPIISQVWHLSPAPLAQARCDSTARCTCHGLRVICHPLPWNQTEIIFCRILNLWFVKTSHAFRLGIFWVLLGIFFLSHFASFAISDAFKHYIRSPEQNLSVNTPHLTAIMEGSFKTQALVLNAGKSCPRDKKRGDNW